MIKTKKSKSECIRDYIIKNPNAPSKEISSYIMELFKDSINIYPTISRVRKALKKNKTVTLRYTDGTQHISIPDIIRTNLIRNPNYRNIDLQKIVEKTTGVKCKGPLNGTMIKKIRKEITQGADSTLKIPEQTPRSQKSKKSKLYMTIWSCPSEKLNNDSRGIFESFINELNSIGRTKFEIIERLNPNVLEVREQA